MNFGRMTSSIIYVYTNYKVVMNNDVMMDQHIPFYKLDKKVRSEKMMGRHNFETKNHSIFGRWIEFSLLATSMLDELR